VFAEPFPRLAEGRFELTDATGLGVEPDQQGAKRF
jgi:L-alanine-DL-glutamate epimerase-like enolase superfamily enzyme